MKVSDRLGYKDGRIGSYVHAKATDSDRAAYEFYKRKREEEQKPPEKGPAVRIEEMLRMGFPIEEVVKIIKSDFKTLENDDTLISNWIERAEKKISQERKQREDKQQGESR